MHAHQENTYEYEFSILKSFLKENPIVSLDDLIEEEDRKIDFRFNTEQGIVEIELTRFSKDNGKEAEQENFYDSIIGEAQKDFYLKYKINLHVDVSFLHKKPRPSKKDKQLLIKAIVDTVSKNLARIKTTTGVDSTKIDLRIDNKLVGKIYVDNFGPKVEALWTRNDTYWGRFSPYKELQEIINKKNNNIARYKSCSDKTYLLIHANRRLAAEAVIFNDDILNEQFYSKFDKVFFFDVYSKDLYSLKIISSNE